MTLQGRKRPDPRRPAVPPTAGWQPDPWGDGERYWDGEIWTRQTRPFGGAPATPIADRVGALDEDEVAADARPLRSGLVRGMIWAFAVLGIIALLLTAVSMLPLLLRSGTEEVVVPVQSAQAGVLLHLTGSFHGSVHD